MPETNRPRKWVWGAVALGAIFALVVSVFATRALAGGDGGFAAPSGLSAKPDTGFVSLSKSDAKVDIQYGFKDDPAAGYTDELILKRVPIEGMDVGYWRIDDVVYADGTDLRDALVHAFDGY